ncbi:MAG: ATP-dependent helicase HrpB [Hyphomicrobium sp.]
MALRPALPIDEVLQPLTVALAERGVAVLVAPPGAGKTTRVPLALLDQTWLGAQRIIMLEPRRIAARGAAEFMAKLTGGALGGLIGLKARLATKVSAATRIVVVTEGVFTRMILDDPELKGIGAVLFDEFHERSLDADLGLALALDARQALRPDLRLVVMSATLDGARVAKLIGDAPVIVSEGRAYPVETRYLGRRSERIDDDMTTAIMRALAADSGSILAFLPGQAEIKRVAERLLERVTDSTVDIAPLYGAMDAGDQDRAIKPASAGRRKVVLATTIAETSITIEGVRVVIDSGVTRVPRFEPEAGITRLVTVRVSRAAAEQRRGRAGRLEPGVCYRLWDEPETQGLLPFADPEIKSADLAGLLLDCAEWGARDPAVLSWLDPPSPGALKASRAELESIGALDGDGRITELGGRLRALPLPPRVARMLISAAEHGAEQRAAMIAAVLVERGLGGNDCDLMQRLHGFNRDRGRRADDMRRLARGWASAAATGTPRVADSGLSDAALLALAFPERIAKARGAGGQFLLANGRAGYIDTAHPLSRAAYVVAAELQGRAAATRILLAAEIDEREVALIAGHRIATRDELVFDEAALAVRARRARKLDAIVLSADARPLTRDDDTSGVLAAGVSRMGVGRLAWSKAQQQLRARVAFLRAAGDTAFPDLSDEALGQSGCDWLKPFLDGKSRVAEIGADDLAAALDAMLPWALRQKLEADAPTHFDAPTGNRFAVDYEGAGAPALHIRVQELYGLKQHPAIAGGRLPLTLNLLSPAHRPIQITRDLPGFWAGSWRDVKGDMRGQYPKHLWPDDPANATATARAKPRPRPT